MDLKDIDELGDKLNGINRLLSKVREDSYYLLKENERLRLENERLRDENSKLMIDVAFYDKKLPKESS